MKHTVVLTLAILFVMSGGQIVGVPRHESADATTATLDRVIEINLSNATLMLALSTLAIDHRIPIGFEHAMDARVNPNRQIHLKSDTLKNILDSVVAQEPSYKWELRDGAINITPIQGRDPFLAQFLDTKVNQFVPPTRTTNKFTLRDSVLSLPEVRQLLAATGVAVRPYDYPYARSIYSNDNVDLTMSKTDVRGILNRIAKETEHKMWDLERVGDQRELLLTY